MIASPPIRQLVVAGAAGICLAACGHHPAGGSQVVAKVNRDEITVLELNQQLARLPAGLPPEQREEGARRALAALVDQQLLVQQAIEHKLDRDPEVVGALEAARQQLLAQAYVQRVLGAQAKPTDQEMKQYYAENPALFAERRIYRLQELSIRGTPDQIRSLEEHAKGAKSLQDLAVWLKDNKMDFNVESAVRTAEQLPLERLPQLAKMKDGQVALFHVDDNRASALQVLASQAQPVDDKQAAPSIEQFLTNRKRNELAQAEMKHLREVAKIEYIGEFTKLERTGAAAAAPTARATGPTPLPEAAAAEASKASSEKGIAGLR